MSTSLTSFEDGVKAKLKESIADLIPQDRLDRIVRATIEEFTTKDLPNLVKAELQAMYKAKIAEEFAKPEWQAKWLNASQLSSEAVKQLLIEAAPLMLANMMTGAAQSVVYNLQQALQNSGARAY